MERMDRARVPPFSTFDTAGLTSLEQLVGQTDDEIFSFPHSTSDEGKTPVLVLPVQESEEQGN